MESALTKAYTIKFENFEGPFDLLFHLLEKNKIDIYDIPINEITDQYLDYLFTMQQLDLEIASEFLLMAATLLHIKSRMLLPSRKLKEEQEIDPREELILKLVEYKKYKIFTQTLKEMEKKWEGAFYKLPEVFTSVKENEVLDLSVDELRRVYFSLLEKNKKKTNNTTEKMATIIQNEKVSLRSKMRDIIKNLFKKAFFGFSELFSLSRNSKAEVVTGFLAVLELSKLKRIRVEQTKHFEDIIIHRVEDEPEGSAQKHFEHGGIA